MIWPPACTRQGQSEEAAGAHNCKSMAHDEEQDEDRRRRPSREWADTMATDAGDWMARTITQDQKLNDLNSINSLTTFNERLCFHLVDVPPTSRGTRPMLATSNRRKSTCSMAGRTFLVRWDQGSWP